MEVKDRKISYWVYNQYSNYNTGHIDEYEGNICNVAGWAQDKDGKWVAFLPGDNGLIAVSIENIKYLDEVSSATEPKYHIGSFVHWDGVCTSPTTDEILRRDKPQSCKVTDYIDKTRHYVLYDMHNVYAGYTTESHMNKTL
jgi:hypothetical protein